MLYHDPSAIAYARRAKGRELIVAASRHEQKIVLPISGEFVDLLSGTRSKGPICVEPDSVVILERIGGSL